ncbi:MAG: discoidin domain-containing protein [Verrucomicrobiaceae bacterium]
MKKRNKLSLTVALTMSFPVAMKAQETQIDSTTITATASNSFDARFTPDHILDGETLEGFRNTGDAGPPERPAQHQGNHWITADNNLTATLTFNLGGVYNLTRLEVLNSSNTNWNDRETDQFTIETSTDGGDTWSAPSSPVELQDYVDGFQEVIVDAEGINSIRLNCENLDNDQDIADGTTDTGVGLNEIRFFATPPEDSDDDGLPDSWEISFFGDLSRTGDSDDDVDENDAPAPDGLTNAEELANGTSPIDPDSDDDTLLDGAEVKTHNSNPLAKDTDGDRLTDPEEVNIHGSNPTLVDTDGDELNDFAEVNTFMTLPNDDDTDDDTLLDGAEVLHLLTDPLVFTSRVGLIDPTMITVTAGSTQEPRFDAQNLVDELTLEGFKDQADPDGLRPTQHQDNHWMADDGVFNETLTFDLGATYNLTHLEIRNTSNTNWNDAETNTFTTATSTDGGTTFSTPSKAITLQDYLDGFQTVPLIAAGVTHVQLAVTNIEGDGPEVERRVGLNEVRFYEGEAGGIKIQSIVRGLNGANQPATTISFTSIPNATYKVEASVDLENWIEINDSITSEGLSTVFIDDDPTIQEELTVFYRVLLK